MKKILFFLFLFISMAGYAQTQKDSLKSIKALRTECQRMARIASLNSRKTHTIAMLIWASRTSHWVDTKEIDRICDSIYKADKVFP